MQPVYVGDVADAVLAALETEGAKGQIYQLGGPQTYSFADLMRFTLTCVGRRRFLIPYPFQLPPCQLQFLVCYQTPINDRSAEIA